MSIGQGRWIARQVNIRVSGDAKRPYRIVQVRRAGFRSFSQGVGIMTRMPIIYHDSASIGYDGVACRANIELPAGAAGTRRQSLDFVSVQLHHGATAGEARHEQAMSLVGWLNEKRRVPLQVISGDFNEPPDCGSVNFMRQTYRSALAEYRGRDPYATYPTNLVQPQPVPAVCLDYVFLSPAVYRVTKAGLFADKAAFDNDSLYPSDHVGLLVGLEV